MIIKPIVFEVDLTDFNSASEAKELIEAARDCNVIVEQYFDGDLDEEYTLDYLAEHGIDVDETLDMCEENLKYAGYLD